MCRRLRELLWGVFERVRESVYVSAKSAHEVVIAPSRGSVTSSHVHVEGTQQLRCDAREGACVLLLYMYTRQLHTPYLYRCATFTKRRHISPGMVSLTYNSDHLTDSVKRNIFTCWYHRYQYPLASDLAPGPPSHAIAFFRSDINWSNFLLHAPYTTLPIVPCHAHAVKMASSTTSNNPPEGYELQRLDPMSPYKYCPHCGCLNMKADAASACYCLDCGKLFL